MNLRFGLPPLNLTPYYTYFPGTSSPYRGFVPLVFDRLALEMGASHSIVEIDVDPVKAAAEQLQGKYDITVSPIEPEIYSTMISEFFVYTAPVYDSVYGALVLKTTSATSLWRLFGPFTPELWYVVIGGVFALGAFIVIIDALSPVQGDQEGRAAFRASNIAISTYHAWAFMLGGEDYEWLTWAGRILRLTFLFVVLILVSTYTANLAAFFTAPSYKIHGPKDMDDLRQTRVCTLMGGFEESDTSQGFNPDHLKPYIHSQISPPIALNDRQTWCADQLRSGAVGAWIDDIVTLNDYYLRNCQDLASVEAIRFLSNIFVLRILRSRWRLESNISAAVSHLRLQPWFMQLQREEFSVGISCKLSSGAEDTEQVSVRAMGGLFIIYAAGVALALICAFATMLLRRFRVIDNDPEARQQPPTTEGEMLKVVLDRLQQIQTDTATLHSPAFVSMQRPAQPISSLFNENGARAAGDPCHSPAGLHGGPAGYPDLSPAGGERAPVAGWSQRRESH